LQENRFYRHTRTGVWRSKTALLLALFDYINPAIVSPSPFATASKNENLACRIHIFIIPCGTVCRDLRLSSCCMLAHITLCLSCIDQFVPSCSTVRYSMQGTEQIKSTPLRQFGSCKIGIRKKRFVRSLPISRTISRIHSSSTSSPFPHAIQIM
jgi:hypothetical protein